MTQYPTTAEIQTAMQHPHLNLVDPVLRGCEVERTTLGQPRPRSGGFAVTFKLSGSQRHWAVRCFKQAVQDLGPRYSAIARATQRDPHGIFVPFEYQAEGIRVQGMSYPVLKMEWVEGQTLGVWLEEHAQQAAAVSQVADNFRQLVSALEEMGIAHGDLQHGNIVVRPNLQLKLIDYDGMWVPGLPQEISKEIGHKHFQHPGRGARHFGPRMDRFSALSVYTSLRLIAGEAALWEARPPGEHLLFRRQDYENPDNIGPFAAAVPEAAGLVHALTEAARGAPEAVPSLLEVLHASKETNRLVQVRADDLAGIMAKTGERVEVVGVVRELRRKLTQNVQPYFAVFFGERTAGAFRVTLQPQPLRGIKERFGENLERLIGQRVAVEGTLVRDDDSPVILGLPVIDLEYHEHMRIYSGSFGEPQADNTGTWNTVWTPPPAPPRGPRSPLPSPEKEQANSKSVEPYSPGHNREMLRRLKDHPPF